MACAWYYCSPCKMSLTTEKRWLNHLLRPDHQAEARKDLVSWDLKTKERVLVAFGKFPVATEDLLRAFSEQSGSGRSNLTGFAWNEKRPHVGFISFETREKAESILDALGEGSQMRIGNCQLLQLKKATDYLDWEWERLFAKAFHKHVKTEFKAGINNEKLPTGRSSKRFKLKESPCADRNSNSNEMELKSAYSDDKRSDSEEMELEEASVDKMESGELAVCSQFGFISREVEARDGVQSNELSIMERFQRVLAKYCAYARLYMLRNLQGATGLVFYVDAEGVLADVKGQDEVSSGSMLPVKFLAKHLACFEAQQILGGIKGGVDRTGRTAGLEENDTALYFEDMRTKAIYILETDRLFAAEAQTCRLFNYLLEFDLRAKPFLSLILYWAEQNEVKIKGPSSIEMLNELSHALAPEPTGLMWMVIFFLCYKRILPTPRKILRREKNSEVWYDVGKSRIDIGFRMEDRFAYKWRVTNDADCPVVGTKQFVRHLVTLCKEFFEFYGELRSTLQPWVLNTRDGELVRKEDLLEKRKNSMEVMICLKEKERARLRNSQRNLSPRHVKLNGLAYRRFTILHPLIIDWTIPCDEDNFFGKICIEMLASAKIIEIGLQTLDGDQDEDNENISSLQNLFRKATLEEIRPFL